MFEKDVEGLLVLWHKVQLACSGAGPPFTLRNIIIPVASHTKKKTVKKLNTRQNSESLNTPRNWSWKQKFSSSSENIYVQSQKSNNTTTVLLYIEGKRKKHTAKEAIDRGMNHLQQDPGTLQKP
jgi:hypothetical protein